MGFEEVELDVLRAGDTPLRQEPSPAEISNRQKPKQKRKEVARDAWPINGKLLTPKKI